MNSDIRSSDKHERDAHLKEIEDTHFFDVDSGIYKPKSCRTEAGDKKQKRGANPSTPFFVNPATDGCFLTVATFSALVGFATFVVVGLYTYFAHGQWQEMIRAATATEKAATAAHSSAVTAENILKSSQQQFRTEQRPYIWATPEAIGHSTQDPNPFVLVPLPNGNYRVGLIVTYINGGHSPAQDTFASPAVIHVTPKSHLAKEVASYIPNYDRPGEITIPQVKMVVRGDPIDITPAQYSAFMNGDLAIYVIGTIKYRDIFEPTIPPYETQYCFTLNPRGFPFGGGCGGGTHIK